MIDFDEEDERKNKNQHCTYDEIDERQVQELLILLDQWQKGEKDPLDILLQTTFAVGCRPSFLIEYDVSRKYGPGTSYFQGQVDGYREKIASRSRGLGRFAKMRADHTLEWIERLQKSSLKPDAYREFLTKQTAEYKTKIDQCPEWSAPLKSSDDIIGPSSYVEALQSFLAAKNKPPIQGNALFTLIVDNAVLAIREEKKQADYEAAHVEEAVEKNRQRLLQEYQGKIDRAKNRMRPEVLTPGHTEIQAAIQDISRRLEACEFDSWAAASAMVDVLLKPPSDYDNDPYHLSDAINDFRCMLAREKESCEARRENNEATLKTLEPETEESIKAPLARKFAAERAYQVWKSRKVEEYKKEKGEDPPYYHSYRQDFEWADEPGVPKDDEIVEFLPNGIDYPGRELCHEIQIEPSGTGLIEIYPRHEESSFENEIYGTEVARITTYAVSFVPKNPADAEILCDVVTQAIKQLAEIPYFYELPGWTPSGRGYERVGSGDGASSGVRIKDGKIEPYAKFDLDDLWVLYFLLEPVIEPSSQIAAAMNAARYAEERGAVLTPHDFGYVQMGHKIADESGYLKKETGDVLQSALVDIFTDLALRKTDKAEFTARVMGLADQVLKGRLVDLTGAFQPYSMLLEDQRQKGSALVSYQRALADTTQDMIRCLTGQEHDSQEPLHLALQRAVHQAAKPLKERSRQQSKTETIEFRQALDRHMDYIHTHAEELWDQTKKSFSERNIALDLSDAFAGRAGQTDEDRKKASEKALANAANIVLADSEVETCVEGVHGGGRYVSRPRGSLFVRKELPEKLKPFAPQSQYTANPIRLLSNTL